MTASRVIGWVAMGPLLLLPPVACHPQERAETRQHSGAASEPWFERVREQMSVLSEHKRELTPERAKLATGLLLEAERHDPNSVLDRLPQLETRLRLDEDGRVLVDVDARITPALLRRAEALGGEVVLRSERFRTLRLRLPVASLLPLARESAVRSVRPATRFVVRQDDTSEGDVAHRADVVRDGSGVDGSGITIGVISDGVQSLASARASGDLPDAPQLQVVPGQAGQGNEGTAMLEIVHDLAPGATLWFATAGPFAGQMAENIEALVALGCDIIVDDILFLNEVTFQDDVVARAAAAAIDAGVLFYSASGNSGNAKYGTSGTWEGDYAPSSSQPAALVAYPEDWLDVHAFGQDLPYDTLTEDAPYVVALEWADPLGGAGNDFDLFLLSADLQDVVAASIEPQDGTGDPFEAIDSEIEDDVGRNLVIARWQGAELFVRLATHTGTLDVGTNGQINGHPAVDGVFAISAVDVDVPGGVFVGGAANPVEPFVSDGPRRVFFAADGSPLTSDFSSTGGELRLKPDFSAADGVEVTTPGFAPFHGTSAAAPHAAALAALVLEANPEVRALTGRARTDAVRELFSESALDIEGSGFDDVSGEGIMMADAALPGCGDEPDGTACDDRDACTGSSSCQGGSCVGSDAVVCTAIDECHEPGVCDPSSGACDDPEASDGTPCTDASACTIVATCQEGTCTPEETIVCPAADACYEASICDADTGECGERPRRADDSGCDDDGDGVSNGEDACPAEADPEQIDTDLDGDGDVCDDDDDGDGQSDVDELGDGTDPLDPNDPSPASGGAGSSAAGSAAEGGGSNGGSAAGGSAGSDGIGARGGETTASGAGGNAGAANGGGRPSMNDAGGLDEPAGAAGGLDGQAPTRPSKFHPIVPVAPDAGRSVDTEAPSEAPNTDATGSSSGCDCRVQPANSGSGLLVLLVAAWAFSMRRWKRGATFRRLHPCVGRPNGPC